MKIYNISFHPEAMNDLKKINHSVQIQILKQIKKLSISPELGEALGNKFGINLTGLRKLYVNKKQIRIVYQIIESRIEVLIIGIGKRESNLVCETAKTRINL